MEECHITACSPDLLEDSEEIRDFVSRDWDALNDDEIAHVIIGSHCVYAVANIPGIIEVTTLDALTGVELASLLAPTAEARRVVETFISNIITAIDHCMMAQPPPHNLE